MTTKKANVFYKQCNKGRDGVFAIITHPQGAVIENQIRITTEIHGNIPGCEERVNQLLGHMGWIEGKRKHARHLRVG